MSSFQHILWLYLWIAPHVLLIAVAVLMFHKGLHKDFPIFVTYLLFEFLQFCILFGLRSFERVPISVYQDIDMFGRVGSIALRFGIIQEMFEAPLAHNIPLRRTVSKMLNRATAIIVVLASIFIGFLYYGTVSSRAFPPYAISQALNTVQCCLLALVFLWHRFLNLRMSPVVFGIALGMGLVAGFEPLMHALKDSIPEQNSRMVDLLQMAIYHCAVLIWVYYAYAREKFTSNVMAAPLLEVRRGAADLGRVIHL